MKTGDKVKVIDSSWSLSVTDNGLIHYDKGGSYLQRKNEWIFVKVVEYKLPTYFHEYNDTDSIEKIGFNNVILIHPETKEVVFTRIEFLTPVPQICPTCHRAI